MRILANDRVIARSDNVVLVDFSRRPEPPAPRFPGAGGLRKVHVQERGVNWVSSQEQTVFDQIDCS
jgi:hypothetical protein